MGKLQAEVMPQEMLSSIFQVENKFRSELLQEAHSE